jgi:hypothetical protein
VTSPVQQAPEQQVVTSPVYQAPSGARPVHQAPPRELLQGFPEPPPPATPLQIEPLEEQGKITSPSTPDSEPQQALLPAPGPTELQTTTAGNERQLIVPPSRDITLPDAPTEREHSLIPFSQELYIPNAPADNQIVARPFSREVTFTEAPILFSTEIDVERNYWAESPPNVPGLVKKFEDLLVDVSIPDQWNTEHSRTGHSSSSTHSTSSLHSPDSDRMSPSGKQPQRPDPPGVSQQPRQAEAAPSRRLPTWAPDERAEAGPSRTVPTWQTARQPEADPARPHMAWEPSWQTASQPGTGPSRPHMAWEPTRQPEPEPFRSHLAWEPARQDARTDQTKFFKPSTTFPTYGGGQYPYAPNPWERRSNREQELKAENDRLRKAYEQERRRRQHAEEHRTFQLQPAQHRRTPYAEGLEHSRHAPSGTDTTEPPPSPPQSYHTTLLEQLTRFHMDYVHNQARNDERILHHLPQNKGMGSVLKATDVGIFEPKAMPDSEAAMDFIDNFRGAAIHYGEEWTMADLRKCCKNKIAHDWLAGMKEYDSIGLSQSLDHWERLLCRDFMPRSTQLYAEAKAEVFKWTQNRSPAEYITHKLRLLRLTGVTEESLVVEELHAGFARCTEMHIPLEPFVLSGNGVDQYRRAVQSFQASAKLQYIYGQKARSPYSADKSRFPYGTDNRREKGPAASKQNSTNGAQAANTPPSYPRADSTHQRGNKRGIVRKRKCKNYPHCGDGEHFDWECKKHSNEPLRAYYASSSPNDDCDDVTIDADDGEEGLEWREPDPDLEEEYKRQQNAYFALIGRAVRGFMAATSSPKTTKSKPPKRIPPKPSECRKCHIAFPSRNQLHRHVTETGHNVQTARPVIESVLRSEDNDQTTLASFHYAKAEFMLSENDHRTSLACVDSGYGNSAVDKRFLETHVQEPVYQELETPVVVRGIGGAKVTCKQVAIFSVYWPTLDGRLARITRPYHIFPDLGCELLIGIDTIYTERIDLFFSAAIPQMRLGTCEGASVRISVFEKKLVGKIPVRAAKRTVVPANSTTVVEIKLGCDLPQNQDSIFTPSKLRTVSAAGAGAPHGIFTYQKASVLFTNINDRDITIFHNTVLGHVESI